LFYLAYMVMSTRLTNQLFGGYCHCSVGSILHWSGRSCWACTAVCQPAWRLHCNAGRWKL